LATILVVDDVAVNRELLTTLFGYVGYDLLEASDGQDALRVMQDQVPDLIFTDLVMPNMDGYEFLRSLRSNPRFCQIQVVVYTATYLEAEAAELARRAGAFCFLRRPAEVEVLLATAEAAIAAPLPVVEAFTDVAFATEHRRLLTDKLAQKITQLEEEITRRSLSEQRLVLALGAAQLQVWDWDAVTKRVTRVSMENEATQPTVSVQPFVFEDTLPSIQSSDRANVEAVIANALKTGDPFSMRYHIFDKDGNLRGREVQGKFQLDEAGEVVRGIGTQLDITARAAAAKERELLAALVENSPDFIGSVNLEGVHQTVNPAGRRMIGLEESAVLSDLNMFDFLHGDSHQYASEVVLPANMATGEWRGELLFKNQVTGKPIPCECRAFTVKSEDGAIQSLAIIARDITDRKETERELADRLAQLTAFRRIDVAISSSADLRLTLEIVVGEIRAMDDVVAADIYLCYGPQQNPELATGLPTDSDPRLALAELAVRNRVRVERPSTATHARGIGIVEAVPLISKGFVKGVLVVKHHSVSVSRFLEALAGQLAVTIDGAQLFEDLERSRSDIVSAYDETLEGWARALDLRDKETEGHSRRVTEITMQIARAMKVNREELPHFRRGALLHDIGKLAVPDAILHKPGALTPEEWHIMRKHAEHAFEILAPIEFLRRSIDIPYCHHEKWDGTGYPRGLKGKQIPLSARIFALADVWDALRSDRPYRPKWSFDKALDHIKSQAGTHFDPEILDVFVDLIQASRGIEGTDGVQG